MARQIVYPHEEILAKDINNFVNSMETIFFKSFIGNALPNLPAFIGTSFLCEISGSDMVIKKGIAFMEKNPAPTDGSTPIALIQLSADKTVTVADLGIALPAVGSTAQVSVGVKWALTNKPSEDRTFTTGTGNEERSTVTMNEWDSTFDYHAGTSAATGFVKIAEITLNSTGIQSIADNRNYFNMFDPDLFTLFGRKNLAINHVYDGSTNLIELPFEFSSAVDRVDQVSVRKETRGSYNAGVVSSTRRTGNVTVGKPTTASISTSTGVGSRSARASGFESTTANAVNYAKISQNNLMSIFGVNFLNFGLNLNVSTGSIIYIFFFEDDTAITTVAELSQPLGSSIGNNNLYLTLFYDNDNPKSLVRLNPNDTLVFNLGNPNNWVYERYLIRNSRGLYTVYINFIYTVAAFTRPEIRYFSPQQQLAPIYIGNGSNISLVKNVQGNVSRIAAYFSTTNPVSQGSSIYEYKPSSALAIPSWTIKLKSFKFTPTSRELELKLESTASTFPSSGLVFSNFRVKKGTQVRFNTPITNFDSRSTSGNEATYTETLTTQQANALFTSSETLNDVSFEFDISSGTTLPTKDYELLTKIN